MKNKQLDMASKPGDIGLPTLLVVGFVDSRRFKRVLCRHNFQDFEPREGPPKLGHLIAYETRMYEHENAYKGNTTYNNQ